MRNIIKFKKNLGIWFLLRFALVFLLSSSANELNAASKVKHIEVGDNQIESEQKRDKLYKEEIEVEGYKYTYESIPIKAIDSGEIYYGGKITIKNKDDAVFYQELTRLQPKTFGKFPILSKLPFKLPAENKRDRWLVIMCGDVGGAGNHRMLKIFYKGIVFNSTSLEFGSAAPNLSDINGDGFYEAQVYRRILFPEVASGLQDCLMVYKLNIDDVLSGGNYFGFIPVFGPDVAKPYLDYYMQQKEWFKQKTKKETTEDIKITFSQNAGQILSALIATQDKKIICEDIKSFRSYGMSDQDLQVWRKKIKSLDYPDFDFTQCKEVPK